MKKILLFIIAGVIGLGLTSCVKNEESASVTELRNAKAAQLASLAALNNAQAEAILIDANANKALREAQAEYQKALAAVEAARAEGLDIANQQDEIQLQIAQETLEMQIQAAILQAQANLADAQTAFEVAKARLILALDNVADAERTRISALIAEADWVFGNLRMAQNNLITAQSNLLTAQNNLITAEAAKEAQIIEREAMIAAAQAQIDGLNQLGNSTYESYIEEIANVEANVAKFEVARASYYSDWAMTSDLFEDAITELENTYRGMLFFGDLTDTGNYCEYSYVNFARNDYIDFMDAMDIDWLYRTYAFEGMVGDKHQGYVEYENKTYGSRDADVVAVTVDTLVIKDMEAAQQRQVDILTPGYEAAEKAYKDSLDPSKCVGYKALLDALDTANVHWNKAKTEAEKATADAEVTGAENAIAAYEAGAKRTYTNATLPYFEAVNTLEQYDLVLTIIAREAGEDYDALVEKLDGEGGYLDALEESYTYYLVFDNAIDYYNDYVTYLRYIISTGQIENVDEVIANLQTQINGWQRDIDDYRDINTNEQFVSLFTAEIAKLEAQIEVLQAQYDALIAEIQTVIEDAE